MRHPVISNRNRFIIWWLVWLFLTAGQLLLYYFAYGNVTRIFIPDGIFSMLIYSGIAISLWYPFKYFNNSEPGSVSVLLNLLLSGTISVLLWVVITRFLISVVLPEENNLEAYWEATFPFRISTGIFIYGLVVLVYYLFISLFNLSEKNAKAARLESLVKETELKMLRSQINPHFLFNSLNSISSLTITNPEKARVMVIRLSDFMRYSLSRRDEQPVTLRSEFENIRLYLEIEKVRFADRLITEENISADCLETMIPVMLLQPIYENAVKHGVYESTGNVVIKTVANLVDSYLEITITNNYDPAPPAVKGTGTGLNNVARRLELYYGKRSYFQTIKKDGIYSVCLYIPAHYSNFAYKSGSEIHKNNPDEKDQNHNN